MTTELSAEFEKRFRGGPVIQARLSLPTETFSITVLFGPSGSGKTTVLRCLAGLDRPDQGFIRIEEETWFAASTKVFRSPQQRGIGYLSQDYALFPHLTVAGNIAYGLGALRVGEQAQRVQEMVQLLGLVGLESRWPRQLSGGEQQRVALARAVVRRPRLLLLDEPLSALDVPTREQLRRELRRWLARLGLPTVLVTHDRIEALALGDTVVVLDGGQVCQSGPVQEVFRRPASLAVARITGVETVEPVKILSVSDGLATVAVGQTHLVALAEGVQTGNAYISIRAEDVLLEKGHAVASSARNRLVGEIRTLTHEGPMVRIGLDCGFTLTALVTRQASQELELQEGERVNALIKAPAVHLIPRD